MYTSFLPIILGAKMTQEDFFPRVMEFVYAREGGFANHSQDPGGATNMGITIGTLSRWLGRKATVEDVKNLTKEEATKIYRAYYWEPSGASKATDYPTALLLMDSGVLHGIGAVTAWVEEYGYNPWLIMARRLRVYTGSTNWSVFGKGWTNRVALLLVEMGK
jgi:lysozyme family protein